jgi:ABC-type Fe3+ transport system permease subunit
MRPGLLAGWIILATIYMREFSASIFLYSPASEPLGPLLYYLYIDALHGPMAALGIVISIVCIGLIAIAQRYSRWDTQ